jgi:hypothetical protein
MMSLDFFSVYLILPTALWPWSWHSASNKNEYQESSWGVKSGWRVRVTSPPSVSQLSRKCGTLDVSQPYRAPWYVTGTALCWSWYNHHHGCSFLMVSVASITNVPCSPYLRYCDAADFPLFDLCSERESGSVVVKVPCYKPEGCGFDTRWGDF